MKQLLAMSLLSVLLGACTPSHELVYETQAAGDTLKAYAIALSGMYPEQKRLVLQVNNLPDIAPQWGLVGQDVPLRPDVYGPARVYFIDTTARTMRLRLDMELWNRQTRMLYLSPASYSPAEFEQIAQTLKQGLPLLTQAIGHHADESIRKLNQYQVAGLVYGDIDEFTQTYTDGHQTLLVRPNGSVEGISWVSQHIVGHTVRVAINNPNELPPATLAQFLNTKTHRPLRDDYAIVVEQYDPASSSFKPPVLWSSPPGPGK